MTPHDREEGKEVNLKTSCPKSEKTTSVSPDALRLSGVLADLILQNNPKNTAVNNSRRGSSINRWAVDIDRLLRIDNQSLEDVERVIRFSQADDFWRSNILSGATLRKQWDKLTARMNGKPAAARTSLQLVKSDTTMEELKRMGAI